MMGRTFVARYAMAALAAAILLGPLALPAEAQFLVVGSDNKANGIGKDTIKIYSLADASKPQLLTSLPLENSISGPPTNLAVAPGNQIALVANAMHATVDAAGKQTNAPGTQLYVIDLTASPPKLLTTLDVGTQPSGLAISPKGDLALVTFRADNALGVFSISGKEVKQVDTVAMGDPVSSVSFTADGKHALVAKPNVNKIAYVAIDGQKVTYDKYDMNVGNWPYNVVVSPKGDIALTANTSNNRGSDGGVDTVTVIDLTLNPPRVIDYVTVGDAPEGLAISPTGDFAAVAIQNGGSAQPAAFFFNKIGKVNLLRIDGKKVTNVGIADVGQFR